MDTKPLGRNFLVACLLFCIPVTAQAAKWTFAISGYMTGYENVSQYMINPPGGINIDRSGNYSFVVVVDPFVGSTSFNVDLLGIGACYFGNRAASVSGTISTGATGYLAGPVSYYATDFCRGIPRLGQTISYTMLSASRMDASFQGAGPDNGAPVPEPTTWILMVSGFGMIGYTLRAKRREVGHITRSIES